MKKSKLTEKPSRVPDIGQAQKELAITAYLAEIGNLANEAAKSHRFTVLLNALFGLQPGFIEQYVEGIERYVRVPEKDRILRGRADQLSGNLIIEFERDLAGKPKLAEAETQLRQYAAGAWAAEPPNARRKFVCVAADGRRFRAYVPILSVPAARSPLPEQVQLKLIENLDAAKCGWQEFYYFLDRHLLRREILHPTTSAIVKDFGPESHAFLIAEQAILARWEALREQPDFTVLYDAWDRYLRIVYGSPQGDHELFARHTYLASLAKLMVWSRLGPEERQPTEADILSVLEGSWFRDQLSIENFLEEDFFSWLARKEARATAVEVSQMLLALLRNYNLREISEDVLKSLYEGLVDPATRHDLGEYYTPDWLADRMVRRLLAPKPGASVLDPACGSGTFLYMAIREKKRLLGESAKTLDHIFGNVVGMDIHPLACIVAKANYVLALGDLMARRKRKVSVPVYLANSIQPPEKEVGTKLWHDVECYRAQIEAHHVYIPSSFILDAEKYDHAVESARDFALHSRGKNADAESFLTFLKARSPDLLGAKEEAQALFSVAETLKDLIEAGRDTIWVFVLKNIYRPLFLRGRFDLIIGNPPWLSYRYVERSEYQKFLKRQIVTEYELVKERAELVTHLELGTLFLVRAADLYLKPEGRIGFVLPKSIFSADQHMALRSGEIRKVPLRPVELWDLEQVSPLFNISASVYFGRKTSEKAVRPIPGQELSGVLRARNASLEDAEKELTCEDVMYSSSSMGRRTYWSSGQRVALSESHYKGSFSQGATIVPRCFWFVEAKKSELGFDAQLPAVVSSERAQEEAKPAYTGCIIDGRVESRFVYATLLPVDMVPFGFMRLRTVVLPVKISGGTRFSILTADRARAGGYLHLAEWLDRVEHEWMKRRGGKAKDMTAVNWLDYRHKLSQQSPGTPFRSIYATSGTHVCACVLPERKPLDSRISELRPKGFAFDYTTYCIETWHQNRARYIASILNAPVVDKTIKGSQARGLWGARHICKKVLDLPIPKFDEDSKRHQRLAEIAEACAGRVQQWIDAGGPGEIRSIGLLRSRVRVMLTEELAEIDGIVKPMLGL